MPRQLTKLPRWGYTYYLKHPGLAKSGRYGYKKTRPETSFHFHNLKCSNEVANLSEVSCVICRDAGCSQCAL
jgi:hypothetical protein